MQEPKRKFRLNAKNLFLTWPKNDADAGDVMNKILERFGTDNVSYVCVSEELHEDGSPHLHALVCLKSPCNIRDASDLDVVGGGKHGNYQSTRKVSDVYKYVRKGGLFVEHGKYEGKTETEKVSSAVARQLKEGKPLEHVEEMDPGYFMLHQRQILEYQNFLSRKKLKMASRPPPLVYNQWGFTFEIGFEREFKQKQYWIYGPPNTGKTSLVLSLLEHGFRGFIIPINNDFAEWDDECFDFAYIDEFKGQLTVQFLNEWLQGSPMVLNAKFGQRKKTKNIPIFILSNFEPEICYKNVSSTAISALTTRIHRILTA